VSEKRERVARAIHSAYVANAAGYPGGDDWDELSEWEQAFGRKLARAAIKAIRKPTFAMGSKADDRLDLRFRAGAGWFCLAMWVGLDAANDLYIHHPIGASINACLALWAARQGLSVRRAIREEIGNGIAEEST